MSRQYRVTPHGNVIATPGRGTMMGNRGVLHGEAERIRRPWQVERWLICLLEFKGRPRELITPGRNTGLFFLDEATGLTTIDRPCDPSRLRARGPRHGSMTTGDVRASTTRYLAWALGEGWTRMSQPLATCPARIASPAHDSRPSGSASTSGGTSSYDFKVCRSFGRNGPIPLA